MTLCLFGLGLDLVRKLDQGAQVGEAEGHLLPEGPREATNRGGKPLDSKKNFERAFPRTLLVAPGHTEQGRYKAQGLSQGRNQQMVSMGKDRQEVPYEVKNWVSSHEQTRVIDTNQLSDLA